MDGEYILNGKILSAQILNMLIIGKASDVKWFISWLLPQLSGEFSYVAFIFPMFNIYTELLNGFLNAHF